MDERLKIKDKREEDILKDIECEDKEDPFYIDHKRKKKPMCRVIKLKNEKVNCLESSSLNEDKHLNENQTTSHRKSWPRRPDTESVSAKKEDPPLRLGNIILKEPPDVSSDEDVEQELRDLLEQQLKQSMPQSYKKQRTPFPIHHEGDFIKVKEIEKKAEANKPLAQSNRKPIVRYTRSSSRPGVLSTNDYLYSSVEHRLKNLSKSKQDLTRFEATKTESVLDTTPINPSTPPLLYSEPEDDYPKLLRPTDGDIDFSPNTTLSGFQSLNYSLVGSSNDDESKSSSSRRRDSGASEDEKRSSKKTSQELNTTCKYPNFPITR